MESKISHSEIISNFANSIKDKSNFDSVKMQVLIISIKTIKKINMMLEILCLRLMIYQAAILVVLLKD